MPNLSRLHLGFGGALLALATGAWYLLVFQTAGIRSEEAAQ